MLADLHFSELGQPVVTYEQVHKFTLNDKRELHRGTSSGHVGLDLRPSNLEIRTFLLRGLAKVLDWDTFHFEGVVATSVLVPCKA